MEAAFERYEKEIISVELITNWKRLQKNQTPRIGVEYVVSKYRYPVYDTLIELKIF